MIAKWMASLTFVAVLFSAAEAAEWQEISPHEGKMQLETGGGVAEYYATQVDHRSWGTSRCEAGAWGYSGNYQDRAQAVFCWSEDFSSWDYGIGFTDEATRMDVLLGIFGETHSAGSRENAETGPIIETVVGDVHTYVFDVEAGKPESNDRDCMGFASAWEEGHGRARGHYAKALYFYSCGNNGRTMEEEKFSRILSSFSIDGHFKSLIEDR